MMRARLAIATICVAALALPATSNAFIFKPFHTPSKKIACAYIGEKAKDAIIRCDLFFLNDVAYFLGRKGKGHRSHVTDTVSDPKAKTLAYGKSISYGPFTCTSRTSGLTCRNRNNGHGFFVSRQRQRGF